MSERNGWDCLLALLALLLLLAAAALMEIAAVAHFWGAEALVWLFAAKWMLMLIFEMSPPRSSPHRKRS